VKIPFPLQDDEQVVLVTRRHWLYFFPALAGDVLAAAVPVAVLLWLLKASGHFKDTPLRIAIVASVIWLLFWLSRIGLLKYRYDRDLWVVTNRRVVDVVAPNPFRFHMSSADLVQIQDITVGRDGVWESMFDFGDIQCQTAGEDQHFSFRDVPNPRHIGAVVERESLEAKGQRLKPGQ
jgi:hypothetical protein